MYFSIVHWLPLVNGYSGYSPPEHAQLMDAARRLPDPEALALLVRATGLRWILLHGEAGMLPTAPRHVSHPSSFLGRGTHHGAVTMSAGGW